MTKRDIRECITVEYVGTLFGHDLFVDPFESSSEMWRFIAKMESLFIDDEPPEWLEE